MKDWEREEKKLLLAIQERQCSPILEAAHAGKSLKKFAKDTCRQEEFMLFYKKVREIHISKAEQEKEDESDGKD